MERVMRRYDNLCNHSKGYQSSFGAIPNTDPEERIFKNLIQTSTVPGTLTDHGGATPQAKAEPSLLGFNSMTDLAPVAQSFIIDRP
jgi:hypothetical protein